MEDFKKSANRFVKAHFGDRAQHLVPLAAGDWSQAYSFMLDGHAMVIRFGAHLDDFEKDRVMSTLSSDILPIPKVLEVGETSRGYFAVSERVTGKHLDELNGPEIRLVLPQLLEALYELQKLDLTKTKGIGLGFRNGKRLTCRKF
ncbi:hypothetical protein M5X11_20880 [Paenibacillus alginolyticus]|uniref:Aminoglycoside phosphotransferase domain-containing protein n=1 Tax=Paenibacillus alginolyticus TaxID=59839 RepID=A0ABT4GMQ1_9BACL|nr:hypothetical protein [Paenibacillus alginolyticus]MCY9667348.1 hypothetical protein [Paenibacillus alginolyticus]MCY9697496.1 hypothetical protein [Paenibacillus alginolyticus]MEC0141962.1 hypothetical protein [Paenibacillus alginolyticus]